jgi:hypothetical protein
MKQKPAHIDSVSVRRATDFARTTGDATVAKAIKFLDDPERLQRIKDSQCKTCYYILRSRLGGPTATERPCGICGKNELYDTTTTDPICFDCAVKNELCKRCGGDIHMRPRRSYRPDDEREQPKPLTRPA